jgi:hypothetical protein
MRTYVVEWITIPSPALTLYDGQTLVNADNDQMAAQLVRQQVARAYNRSPGAIRILRVSPKDVPT